MYKTDPITPDAVLDLLAEWPGLKQPQILDHLRGELEYDGNKCVVPRPFEDLPPVLKALRAAGRIDFLPKGATGGWRLLPGVSAGGFGNGN
jgi:hypothetical protein